MRHVITRDAFPYVAFQLEITSFSQSSIRERRSLAPLRACQRHAARRRGYGKDLIRNSHPRSIGHHGDSKDVSPSNEENDSTNGGGASMAAIDTVD